MEHVIVLSIALMMMMTHEAVALKRHSQADVFPSLRPKWMLVIRIGPATTKTIRGLSSIECLLKAEGVKRTGLFGYCVRE